MALKHAAEDNYIILILYDEPVAGGSWVKDWDLVPRCVPPPSPMHQGKYLTQSVQKRTENAYNIKESCIDP